MTKSVSGVFVKTARMGMGVSGADFDGSSKISWTDIVEKK